MSYFGDNVPNGVTPTYNSAGRIDYSGMGTFAKRAMAGGIRNVPGSQHGKLNTDLKNQWDSKYGPKPQLSSSSKTSSGGYGGSKTASGMKRRRRKRRTRTTTTKKVAKLTKNVRTLQKAMKSQRSELTYHYRLTDSVFSSVNQANYGDYIMNSLTLYEQVLGKLQFFSPTGASALINADGASGTYQRDYHFKSVYASIECFNNYQVPANVTIYTVAVKSDNTILPSVALSNGLADVGNPSFNSPMIHPTDSPQFNDLYAILKNTKKKVMPGQSLFASFGVKDVYYSPSTADSQTASYQARYKCFGFLVRTEGTYGHDSAAAQQAQLASGLDINVHRKFVVEYDSGIDLKTIYINDAAPSFTNGGLVSSKPVSDNIAYSLA